MRTPHAVRFVSLNVAFAVAAALPAQQPAAPAAADQRVPVLLVSGANNHDWRWTTPMLRTILEDSERFRVDVSEEPSKLLGEPDALTRYAAIVLNYNGPRWGDAAERNFLAAVEGGAGVVVVHAANNAFPGWTEYEKLVGLCWREGTGHGKFHPFDVVVVDRNHAITRGMPDLRMHPDELYHGLVHMHGAEFRVLLSAFDSPKIGGRGRHEPMATVGRFGKGRVFHTPLGHVWDGVPQSRASYSDPQFQRLLQRGTEWAATGACTLDPVPSNWLDDDERAAGFELLFDGRSLAGWRGFRQQAAPKTGWSVKRGAIHHAAGGGGGDLVTEQMYGDFDFRFQWRVAPNANSGVIWRVTEEADQTYMTGPEYQVIDDAGTKAGPKHSSGALYDLVAPGEKELRAAGRWNDGRIVVQGGRVQHWLNGKKLLEAPCAGEEWQRMVAASKFKDWPFGRAERGHLALQDHGDEVWYRSLRLRQL